MNILHEGAKHKARPLQFWALYYVLQRKTSRLEISFLNSVLPNPPALTQLS